MFTGIVEELGTIAAVEGDGDGLQLQIEAPALAPLSHVGDSINVSGCCLTVVAVRGSTLAFEVVPESLRRTAFGDLAPGAAVNLEDALRAGEPYGGHIVQGHVDGVGELVERREDGIGAWLRFRAPDNVQRYLIEKGSVTVAGVSLTVAELYDDGFAVAIVPHTLAVTTFGTLAVGDSVNLEADMIARYVERLLAAAPAPR
ncbi:MAG: riboflavin synthase [Actinomycetota bacterium]|nr:riboflavin synthase [Actinomycetota bacterium]